jgi:hypothetical protein
MDTSYQDVTKDYIRAGQGFQQPSPLVVCELQSAQRGTFCFPFGAGFGCGLELKLSAGAETTLMTRFLAGAIPVQATLNFKVAVEVAYRSHRCEYCRPKVCAEAMLFVWKCERFLGFWSWTTIDTQFVPSVQPLFLTNCTPNDPLCNCPQRVAMVYGQGGLPQESFAMDGGGERSEAQARGIADPASPSALISTATFGPAYGGKSLPADEVAKLASEHVEGLLGEYGDATVAALRGPDAASRMFASSEHEPVDLTLLSRSALDGPRLRVSQALQRLPILAVAPYLPGASADIMLTAERAADVPKEVFSGPAFVGTGRATTIWADIDLSDAALPAGTQGHMTLTLRDGSKRPVATLIEPFVVAPKWRDEGHTE